MPKPSDEDLRTPEEILETIYRVAYTYARERLREGVQPDAVRLTLLLAGDQDPAPLPQVVDAKWRGLEDALAGRLPSPRGWRTWRVDAAAGTMSP